MRLVVVQRCRARNSYGSHRDRPSGASDLQTVRRPERRQKDIADDARRREGRAVQHRGGLGRLKQQVSGPSIGLLAHANRGAECRVSDSGRGKRAGDDIAENQMFRFRRAVGAAAQRINSVLCECCV